MREFEPRKTMSVILSDTLNWELFEVCILNISDELRRPNPSRCCLELGTRLSKDHVATSSEKDAMDMLIGTQVRFHNDNRA